VVWTIPSPSPGPSIRSLGAARLVSTPSPEGAFQGLARDRHVTGFPEFERFYVRGFPRRTQASVQVRCVYQFRHARVADRNAIASGPVLGATWKAERCRSGVPPPRPVRTGDRALGTFAGSPAPACDRHTLGLSRRAQVRDGCGEPRCRWSAPSRRGADHRSTLGKAPHRHPSR
jgi:hypothetical protein